MLALVPLIGYLAMFSWIRISGRSMVTSGGRDIAAIAIAVAGMLAVGPAELFFPSTAATVFGPIVWLALAAFYGLVVSLIALTSAPKLVVFGRTPEETYPPLLRAATRLDPSTIGDANQLQVHLPALGIHLRVDGQRGLDHARILAFEPVGSPRFWNALLGNLRHEMAQSPAPAPRRGFAMLTITTLLIAFLAWKGFGDRALVVEGFRDWLWR
ncbi:hypothetical protein K227x_28030 [Rubripirellula lacrimiformis]|uniref:Uncharacterized protein n=2 Tax=Rubripirellula lacrimiformis TaxID=1930273 RepID=A0A517NBA1_9BACT|nr:hypothetical protein K227x_28030 [Rubripirellula lacrimiformis]